MPLKWNVFGKNICLTKLNTQTDISLKTYVQDKFFAQNEHNME